MKKVAKRTNLKENLREKSQGKKAWEAFYIGRVFFGGFE
jgi:hypothetical protein